MSDYPHAGLSPEDRLHQAVKIYLNGVMRVAASGEDRKNLVGNQNVGNQDDEPIDTANSSAGEAA